jgi:hypothetical protein
MPAHTASQAYDLRMAWPCQQQDHYPLCSLGQPAALAAGKARIDQGINDISMSPLSHRCTRAVHFPRPITGRFYFAPLNTTTCHRNKLLHSSEK